MGNNCDKEEALEVLQIPAESKMGYNEMQNIDLIYGVQQYYTQYGHQEGIFKNFQDLTTFHRL